MDATQTTFQKYPAYKDSGVEWLGEIPEHWETSRLRNVFSFSKGLTITKENLQEKGIYCVNYGEIHSKFGFEVNPEIHELKCVSEEYLLSDSNSLLKKGDFVFADTSEDIEGSGNFTYLNSDLRTFAGYHTIIARLKISVNERFAAYVIASQSFRNQIRNRVKGVKVFSISQSLLKTVYFWFPNTEEQTAIAAFLDDKTAKIDRAIAQKEKMIALLKERKQIIIQDAVTKGLDPNAKMKDSGVECLPAGKAGIGEVPSHWEVKRLRNVFSFSKGLTITKENLQDNGIPCVNYGEIHSKYGFEVNPEIHPLNCVSEEYLKNNSNSLIKKGDFIFADTSEDLEGSGNFSYLNFEGTVFAGYHTIIGKPMTSINSRFLAYVFHSLPFRNQVRTRMKGVKVFSITQSILKDLICWFPQGEEQKSIVSFLDTQSAKIDPAISLQEQQIGKLKELKATLIDGAVTGKIKVH